MLVVTGMALTACESASTDSGMQSSEAAASSAEAQPQNPNAQAGVPLPADAVDNAVAKLDDLVNSMMSSTKIPGLAVAVVQGSTSKYAKGFGVTDVKTGAKVDADTVFPLASLSKPVGSTVIAKEITDGVIAWDTPVSANLPGFTLSDPYVTQTATVADFYAHRSGLPDHAGDKVEDLGYNRQQVLERLRFIPLQPFRITYDYTNFGITAAAESVARKAGQPWDVLSRNAIYTPLGMARTSSSFAEFETRSNRVVGHVKVGGQWVPTPAQRDPDEQSPAGGVSSSINDMQRWLEMVLANGRYDGKQLLSPEALTPAITAQIISSPSADVDARPGFYGYGFNTSVTEAGRTQISHSGAFSMGAATNFLAIPSANVAIVVLSNAAPIGAVEALTGEFADLVQFGEVKHQWRELYGPAFEKMSKPSGELSGQKPPSNPVAPQPLPTYEGTYQNDLYGPAVVRQNNGGLVLAMGPDGQKVFRLAPWDGNTFTYTLRNENAELGSVAKVAFDPAANTMTIDYYADDVNNGVFTRSAAALN